MYAEMPKLITTSQAACFIHMPRN